MSLTSDERFWKRVRRGGLNECWQWLGRIGERGYGMVDLTRYPVRHTTTAHRVVYERLVGPIPEGLDLDHLCRNRQCVNPRHIEPVTRIENLRRGRLALRADHCKHGHPFTEANARYVGDRRFCRACDRDRARRYRASGG